VSNLQGSDQPLQEEEENSMCLDKITKSNIHPEKVFKAYKILLVPETSVTKAPRHLHWRTPITSARIPVGKWVKDTHVENLGASEGGIYKSGFHVFTNRRSAKKMARWEWQKIVQVKVRSVIVEGTECFGRVLVAQEIFIPATTHPNYRDWLRLRSPEERGK
jgi:hypothetical protein